MYFIHIQVTKGANLETTSSVTLGARNGATAEKGRLSRFFGLPRMVHGRSLGSPGVTLLQNTTSAISFQIDAVGS